MTAIGRKRTSWFMNSEEKQKQIKNVFIVLTFLIIGSSAYHVHLLLNRDEQLIEKEVVRSYKACNANICYQELYFEDGEPPKKIKVTCIPSTGRRRRKCSCSPATIFTRWTTRR